MTREEHSEPVKALDPLFMADAKKGGALLKPDEWDGKTLFADAFGAKLLDRGPLGDRPPSKIIVIYLFISNPARRRTASRDSCRSWRTRCASTPTKIIDHRSAD